MMDFVSTNWPLFVVVAIILLWSYRRKWFPTATLSATTQGRVVNAGSMIWNGISGDTSWILLAFVFLDVALYLNRNHFPIFRPMFEGWGWLHLLIYPIGIVIFSGVEKMAKSKRRAFALAMVIVAFAVWGIAPHTDEIRARLNSDSSASEIACRGVYEKHKLTATSELMEDGADCRFNYSVKYGAVEFCTELGQCTGPVYAGHEIALSREIKYVKWHAVGDEAIVHIAFCNPHTNWDGSKCG